ncbi:lipopolysaccharide biosynthesis protein [Planomonospora sp. ID67723]|uniref:lipopolysaccharide biosynthesis protein n=1 Tax=Planomonospora sp. ID67723 TaxID=2738134 RepID=UPI0018C39DEF|nr:lipopolysaccharide biosynthesis protein [Planomonospora sp. ID67723]MBG0827444.1 lipopolysaccharide biosynthesis protein [Planomonospora sp. ID67723]
MTALGGRAGRALGWSFLNTVVARLGTLAIGIALARILGPEEFGVFAVAMVALLAMLSFNELGVSLAIVRWPGDPREIAPTVMTLATLSSCVVYAGCYLGAPAFTAAMRAPEATDEVRLLALNVIIAGLVITPVALLQREFRQDRKMLADQVNNWLGAFVSIGLALLDWGAMSLAVGRLAGSVASGILFLVFAPVRFGFDPGRARALLGFGLPLAGSSIVFFAVSYVDQLVIGSLLGPVALGSYSLAINLANWPHGMFSQPARQVAPAVWARLQGEPVVMRRTFLTHIGLLAAVTFPVCVLLTGTAESLIRFVYGPEWLAAADALVWLGALVAMRILFDLIYDYFITIGSTRVLFAIQVTWLVTLVPAVYFGVSRAGIFGAGGALVGVAALVILPLYVTQLRRTGVAAGALAGKLAVPLLVAVTVGLACVLVRQVITPDFPALVVCGLIAVAAVGLLGLGMRETIRGLRSMEATG